MYCLYSNMVVSGEHFHHVEAEIQKKMYFCKRIPKTPWVEHGGKKAASKGNQMKMNIYSENEKEIVEISDR